MPADVGPSAARAPADTAAVGPAPGATWVRTPQQARARRTFERVLDAAARLLSEQGYAGFSISEVCRAAGVSPGALYDRVDGKDTLFLAVLDRELTRITASAQRLFDDPPRWQPLSTPALVTEVLRALVDHFLEERGLLSAFILRSAVDDRARQAGSVSARVIGQAVTSLLLTRATDYPHPNPAVAVRTAYSIALDSLGWRTAFGLDFAEGEVDQDAWAGRLAAVCGTYLLTAPV